MKYIITESRLKELFHKFLDNYKWQVADGSDDMDIFVYADGKLAFHSNLYTYFNFDGPEDEYILYIETGLYSEIKGFFGERISPWDLVKWFNKKFNNNAVAFDWFTEVTEIDDDD